MKYIIAMFIFCFMTPLYAALYMQQDKNGNITYSDMPLNNSKEIEVPNVSSTTSVPPSSSSTTGAKQSSAIDKNAHYKTFVIVSPKDNETIQNQPTLPVLLKINPALRPGDKILLLVDGKPWGNPQANTYLQAENIERGTHQLSAVLIDKDQVVLQQSNTITIFNHRASANFNPQ